MVGCGHATDVLKDGQKVTVSCAEGDTGSFTAICWTLAQSSEVTELPDLPLKIMMNVGNPDRAFDFARLPNEGVGPRAGIYHQPHDRRAPTRAAGV